MIVGVSVRSSAEWNSSSLVEGRVSRWAVGDAARSSRCRWARVGGVRGWFPQCLGELGDLGLFAVGLRVLARQRRRRRWR